MQDAMLELKKLVDLVYKMPTHEWDAFSAIWKPFSAKRKELLTVAGDKERYLYFVIDGVQRVFYNDGDKEATLVFTYPPSFGGVLDALILQQPSRYYYETLTPSTFIRTPYVEVQQLFTSCPSLEKMILKGLSHAFSGVLERLVEIQSFSSEDKFKALLKRSPHILQLVPHKYLANYLGIDATNFSKLINKVKI
jgi:CRP-like cAMP-binding protein